MWQSSRKLASSVLESLTCWSAISAMACATQCMIDGLRSRIDKRGVEISIVQEKASVFQSARNVSLIYVRSTLKLSGRWRRYGSSVVPMVHCRNHVNGASGWVSSTIKSPCQLWDGKHLWKSVPLVKFTITMSVHPFLISGRLYRYRLGLRNPLFYQLALPVTWSLFFLSATPPNPCSRALKDVNLELDQIP